MSTDPITLIADTIRAHRDVIGTTGEPPEIEVSCTCGQSVMIAPDAPDEWAAAVAQFARHRAEAVVTALTQAGHMLPPGGETERKWAITYKDGLTWAGAIDAREARWLLKRCVAEGKWPDPRIKTYTVTRWADGRQHTSPWQEVSGK